VRSWDVVLSVGGSGNGLAILDSDGHLSGINNSAADRTCITWPGGFPGCDLLKKKKYQQNFPSASSLKGTFSRI
jgi:hypothetical protein